MRGPQLERPSWIAFTRPWRILASAGAVAALLGLVVAGASGSRTLIGDGGKPEAATGRPGPGNGEPARAAAERSGIDVSEVVERVAHRVTPVAGQPGSLETGDEHYRAVFDHDGLRLAPGGDAGRFELSIVAVTRGGEGAAVDVGPWTARGNVAERAVARGLTERVTARTGEVEWDVVVADPGPGRGALSVEGRLGGLARPPIPVDGRHGPAWRLALAGGGTVRMGEVVVVDARGRELHRALPEIEGDRVLLTVPASVLATASYPLVIDPTVGPERLVSSKPAPREQANPAVSFDGTNFMVVWEDHRFGSASSDVFGARVSKAGAVLDAAGISISQAAGSQANPAIAFDGTNFVVVWDDTRVVGTWDIFGARVSKAGAVLDATGIPVSQAANNQRDPAIAFDGTNFLAVWEDTRSGTSADIFGARLSKAGAVLDASGIPVSQATGNQLDPAVAFGGTNFLVVWGDLRSGSASDVFGARLSPAGSVLDAAGIPVSEAAISQANPGIAFDGTNFLVVWEDIRSGTNWDVFGARVSTAGAVLDASGIPISQAPNDQLDPAVAFDGTNFLVAWESFSASTGWDVVGARVSKPGSVLDSTTIPISQAANNQLDPAVAFDGTNLFVTWSGLHPGGAEDTAVPFDVFGARVSKAGAVLDATGILVSRATYEQVNPSIAFDGANFLVVWQDFRSGTSFDVFGARVSPTGAVLDPTGFFISRGANDQAVPAVAFDGTNFLVVWQGFSPSTNSVDIFGARVSTGGAVLDPSGFPISLATNAQSLPAIAFNGTNYLVVWQDFRSNTTFDIFGARVSPAGSVLDTTNIPISEAASNQRAPALASSGGGGGFFVAWTDFRAGTTSDIFGTGVGSDGVVRSPTGIPVSDAAGNQRDPSVAFDGSANFFVAWTDFRSGTSSDVYGARVGSRGTLDTAGIPVSQAAGDQSRPAVAFNGSFLVVWQDRRQSSVFDLFAARVGTNGSVLDASGFAVAASLNEEGPPDVVLAPGSQWGVTYHRGATGNNSVFLRSVSPK